MSKTLAEYEELIRTYYEDWASYLGISQQWDITLKLVGIKKSDDEDDSDAECTWPSNYTTAVMKFNRKWLKKQPPDQEVESTVVHELGHLVFHRMWDEINRLFAGELRDRFTNIEETNVDIWTRQIMRARYDGETGCDRCLELHEDSDTGGSSDATESGCAESDSGSELRSSSEATGRSIPLGRDGSGGVLLDNTPVHNYSDRQRAEQAARSADYPAMVGRRRLRCGNTRPGR